MDLNRVDMFQFIAVIIWGSNCPIADQLETLQFGS